MGQAIAKRALVNKHPSIYDTSVLARKYRHDFEALQLSEEQVRLLWDEYCKVSPGRFNQEVDQQGTRGVHSTGCRRLLRSPAGWVVYTFPVHTQDVQVIVSLAFQICRYAPLGVMCGR